MSQNFYFLLSIFLIILLFSTLYFLTSKVSAENPTLTVTVIQSSSCGDGSCNGSESCSSCSTDCGQCGGGGGGGGGLSIYPVNTGVAFSGRAYPTSKITVLKDAQVLAKTISDSSANFKISASGLSVGSYIFGVYSEDSQGKKSPLLTFPVSLTQGVVVE